MHPDSLQILDAAQTMEMSRLLTHSVQIVDSPLERVDVVVHPLFQRVGQERGHIHRTQQADVQEMPLLIFAMVVVYGIAAMNEISPPLSPLKQVRIRNSVRIEVHFLYPFEVAVDVLLLPPEKHLSIRLRRNIDIKLRMTHIHHC